MVKNPISAHMSKIIERMISKRYPHFHVHCSIIHNSQDAETTYNGYH